MAKPITNCPHTDRRHYGHGMCEQCCKNRPEAIARLRERQKAYNAKYYYQGLYGRGKKAARRWNLQKYNLTPEQFDLLLGTQGNRCAICKTEFPNKPRAIHIDHDHTTGKVRSLLCGQCNSGLGHFHDNVEVLKAAVTYLELHEAHPIPIGHSQQNQTT